MCVYRIIYQLMRILVASDLMRGIAAHNPGASWSNQVAFAALKSDGSVVTWGHSSYGGDSSLVSSSLSGGAETVFSTCCAFSALKSDGSVVT